MKNRDFTRVEYAVGASISFGSQVAICTTSNLSLRGMYLRTGFEVPLDMPVHVTVYHSDKSSFKANARVIRRGNNGIGIQITDLNVESFARLRDIVVKQSKDQGTVLRETFKMLNCINN